MFYNIVNRFRVLRLESILNRIIMGSLGLLLVTVILIHFSISNIVIHIDQYSIGLSKALVPWDSLLLNIQSGVLILIEIALVILIFPLRRYRDQEKEV